MQGRQKQPNKQKQHPQELGTAKREPGSSGPDQAVLISHRPPSRALGGGSNRSVPPSALGAGRGWQGKEVNGGTDHRSPRPPPPPAAPNPQPLGTSVCPGRHQKQQQAKPSTLNPCPLFGSRRRDGAPGSPLSLAPRVRPGAEQPEPRPAGSALFGPDPRPSPYLPQYFPAVGTEQVVGGGRRAAAAPVHRGCGHRGRGPGRGRGRAAGWGRAVTAAARAAEGPDRPPAAGRASASASSGRDVGMGGDAPRANGCPKRPPRRLPKRRRRRWRLLLTGPLFHPPPSSRPPPPPG